MEPVGNAFYTLSKPFHPWVVWEMNPRKFPVNSREIGFIGQALALILYIVVSLLTCKKPFNMDRMLHRGIYSEEGKKVEKKPFVFKEFLNKNLLGIDENYTKGDKVLAWSVFCMSFVYSFGIMFLLVVIWNGFSKWDLQMWGNYFYIRQLAVTTAIGIVTTVWFGICGTKDLFQLFKDLETKVTDDLDDGRVVGNMSVSDAAKMKEIEEKEHQQN